MGVGAEDADAVAFLDPEVHEGMRELVAPFLELAVGVALIAVDDGFLVGVELGGAAQEIVDEQWYFHEIPRFSCVSGDSTPAGQGIEPKAGRTTFDGW